MAKFYFTFGSWKGFPYQDTYLVVVAKNITDAAKCFKRRYPCTEELLMNCSGIYDEEAWVNGQRRHYNGDPAEILWAENCFGQKPEGFGDVFIYVPGANDIIHISEGSGDNLNPEDEEEGIVDYIYYSLYSLETGMPETDGGEILLEKELREKYKCLADSIPEVLEMAYGNKLLECEILGNKRR